MTHSFPRSLSVNGKCSLGFAKSKSPENSFGKTESTELALRIPSQHHHTEKNKKEKQKRMVVP